MNRKRYGTHESLTPNTDIGYVRFPPRPFHQPNQNPPHPSVHFLPSPTVSQLGPKQTLEGCSLQGTSI